MSLPHRQQAVHDQIERALKTVIASGTVRFAGCIKATDAWSKGGR